MLTQEAVEWPDQVEALVERLENEAPERTLSREERALMDVYETVPIQSEIDQQRVINSFDLIGATALVDSLNASRWCGSCSPDRGDYSETEAEYLATIEEDLPAGMEELVDLVLAFIEGELE